MRSLLTALLLLALLPAAASAVSVDQIVALSQAGASDEVLLALIDRDKSVFTIEPEQLVVLKRAGVSQQVVLAMLRSGRQPIASPENIEPLPLVAPDVIIVGHGPEIPNVSSQNYAMVGPPIIAGGLVVAGARPCVAARARSYSFIPIVPPAAGGLAPVPMGFENEGAAAQARRTGVASFECRSVSPGRMHSRR